MGNWREISKETLQLIEAASDDRLDDEQFARLDQLIRDDSEIARCYLDCMQFEVDMHLEAYQQRSLAACRETIESLGLPQSEALLPSESYHGVRRFLATTAPRWVDWRTHPARFTATVLTLTLIFWAVVVGVVWPRFSGKDVARQPVSQEEQFEGPIVARVLQVVDAQWDGDPRRGPMPGTHLRQGRRLMLKAGLAKIRFVNGVTVLLEGPATFTPNNENAGDLQLGKLVARVPQGNTGFVVETPRATITDLGTEFGVKVAPEGQVQVLVFEGTVELARKDDVSAARQRLHAGQAIHISSEGNLENIVEVSQQLTRAFRRYLPGDPVLGDYDQQVLADRPVAYWPLSEEFGRVAHDVAGEHHGRVLGAAQRQNDGWPCLALDGRGLIEVPYDPALNPKAFSVEAWVKPSSGDGYGAVISSRDGRIRNGFILYSAPEDRSEFWVGDGQQNWQTVDATRDTVGTWTHVAASFEPKDNCLAGICRGIQRLYVNGQLVAEDHDAEYLPHEEQPHALRIGAGANEKEPDYFLHGKIARVAVYDRVLPSETIRSHYETLRP